MKDPLVSVIIPTYNGAGFLGKAIQSILDQTYQNFELIIVDDQSPDHTEVVVKQFEDPRIKYIRHEINQGAATARGTGRRASSGAIIAFLDQDDFFHPEKLERHVEYLEAHPDIGFTYNAHFELNYSSETIRDIWQPPQDITLADLVLGFPLPPSDWVVRREWAFLKEVWDEYTSLHGREIVVCSRLFMAGCKFARVAGVLNYRRHHAGRKIKHLQENCKAELTCQEIIFSDSRCPTEVLRLHPTAYMNTYLVWASVALAQDETQLGQKFLREAVHLNPSLVDGKPCPLVIFLLESAIADETLDHGVLLRQLLDQLPLEFAGVSQQYNWAVARGYLIKSIRAVIWHRPEDGHRYLSKVTELDLEIDEVFLQRLAYDLLGYETQFGAEAAQETLHNLLVELRGVMDNSILNKIQGYFLANRIFQRYQTGELRIIPRTVLDLIVTQPKYLLNRGILSILIRSLLGLRLRATS